MKNETIPKYHRRDPLLKIVYEWIIKNSRPVVKTAVLTDNRLFPKKYTGENIKLMFL